MRIKGFQLPIIHEHGFNHWLSFVLRALWLVDWWSVLSPRDADFFFLMLVVLCLVAVPHDISSISIPVVTMSISIVLVQALFRQPYC